MAQGNHAIPQPEIDFHDQEQPHEILLLADRQAGAQLSQRTFHRYRDETDSIFGIEIKCDKTNGYRYYIWRDKYGGTDVTEWMLSALRIASLGDMLKYHNKVMLEEQRTKTRKAPPVKMTSGAVNSFSLPITYAGREP